MVMQQFAVLLLTMRIHVVEQLVFVSTFMTVLQVDAMEQ